MRDLENEGGKAAPATDERIGVDQTVDARLYFVATYVVNAGAVAPVSFAPITFAPPPFPPIPDSRQIR